MAVINKDSAYRTAKEMMINGDNWPHIIEVTSLEIKDLKKIQRDKIINNL